MLLLQIQAFMRLTKMSSSRFGREALGDPNFVTDLRDGRSLRAATERRVRTYMSTHATQARDAAR